MKNSHIQVNEGQLLCKLQLIDAIEKVREHKGYRWLATKKTEQSPLVFQSLIIFNSQDHSSCVLKVDFYHKLKQ